jgi:pyridoxal phosphate-dependent aminotransferase EpsN
MSGDEFELVREAFDTNWIAPVGPHVSAFEQEFAEAVELPAAVAVSSGTAALHLGLRLVGVQPGDEVLCSTFTFVASANAIAYVGGTPIFIDSDESTWNMDPDLLAEALARRASIGRLPTAAVVVDMCGQSADYDRILPLLEQYGIPVVEDAAESLGSSYRGKPVGSFGTCATFSFNGNKIITTSGGGMLASSDAELITRGRFLATQARDSAPHYQHSETGYNYGLSNVLAGIGRGQLRHLGERVEARRRVFDYYQEHLDGLPGLDFMPEADYGRVNRWLTCLTVDSSKFGATRDDVIRALESHNIESRPLWKPMHLQPLYEDCDAYGGAVSERLFDIGLSLPSGSALTANQQDRIIDIVRAVPDRVSGDMTGENRRKRPVAAPEIPEEIIPYFQPQISGSELRAVSETLRSGWLTTGPGASRFEASFSEFLGVPYAVALNSCTAALHLTLAAWDIGPGDEVVIPTMTFAAAANVVEHLGAKPVLVDCLETNLNIDPEGVALAVNGRSRVVMPVHYAGQACDMDSIMSLARAHGLKVLEDAAHALPASYRGTLIGGIGDATCFSFYANKTITTGEGGMVVTDDATLAERIRLLSLHGLTQHAANRYAFNGSPDYEIVAAGYKSNMTDVAASLGVEQLARVNHFHEGRRSIAHRYLDAFRNVPEITPLEVGDSLDHAWHLFVIKLDLDRLTVDRTQFIRLMKEAGVGASIHFKPLHLHSFYRDRYALDPADFPVATDSYRRIVSLPIFPSMRASQVDRVIEVLTSIVDTHRQ